MAPTLQGCVRRWGLARKLAPTLGNGAMPGRRHDNTGPSPATPYNAIAHCEEGRASLAEGGKQERNKATLQSEDEVMLRCGVPSRRPANYMQTRSAPICRTRLSIVHGIEQQMSNMMWRAGKVAPLSMVRVA